ncbi:hypothetical protein MLD38_001236 [Melastoma candidum]|uniref:Uncharacterized protein n=1 Tax=Melastoma candidum TaxID=119954 RepID=A0ACB9SDW3_9MYRT|nr:hypothetical protein MLD38_001236 [Melastoma candidum]
MVVGWQPISPNASPRICPSKHSPEKTGFSGRTPRISFSHELILSSRDKHPTVTPVQKPTIDFDFGTSSHEHGSSSTDNLFSDGKIIPLGDIVRKPSAVTSRKPAHAAPTSSPQEEATATNYGKGSKSFWKVTRSRSLGGSGTGLCPLRLMLRSNSTRSTLDHQKQLNSHENITSGAPFSPRPTRRLPTRNSASGNNGCRNVRVEPVPHVRTGNLFGLGSMFICKDRRKRK